MKMTYFVCFPSSTGKIHPFRTGTTIVSRSKWTTCHLQKSNPSLDLVTQNSLSWQRHYKYHSTSSAVMGLLLLEWKGCSCCWSALHIRVAWATWYQDFWRSVPEISLILAEVTDYIYRTNGHLLQDLNQPWLEPQQLESFACAIHQRGAALSNCWGFVDGTVWPICRPGEHQRIMYNGHKRVLGIKFQSVVAPNGLIANLYGPVGKIS